MTPAAAPSWPVVVEFTLKKGREKEKQSDWRSVLAVDKLSKGVVAIGFE